LNSVSFNWLVFIEFLQSHSQFTLRMGVLSSLRVFSKKKKSLIKGLTQTDDKSFILFFEIRVDTMLWELGLFPSSQKLHGVQYLSVMKIDGLDGLDM
jgi:hypothetical protein